ncbi:hypothetical protein KCP75_20310 [Salmonella enterica subsp. enterica]|nr:hypothetical protein KCP75_20310 [Salmonella enterica subsp. enterica]
MKWVELPPENHTGIKPVLLVGHARAYFVRFFLIIIVSNVETASAETGRHTGRADLSDSPAANVSQCE